MADLSTTYLGLKLRTPLVPSASPLTQDLDSVRRLEDAGASALVFYSVFEESSAGETPAPAKSGPALESYLSHISVAKEVVGIPVIASLCGLTMEGWVEYARQLEQAGVNAIELNLYQIPSQLDLPGSEIENNYVEIVRTVKSAVRIPVAAKLTPFFTSMANMAKRFDAAGADGLVLFNRFYQPDINLQELEIQPNVLLSTPHALRLPLTWIGILFGRIRTSLAATSGVHGPEDVVKLLLVGADVTMLCSTLLRNGIRHLRDIESGLRKWMEKLEYESVTEMKGSLSQLRSPDPAAFERAQYINAVKGVQNVVVTGREAWRILTGE
ncbi:MAG: dihydroorotate dehydrogenase-like protein [Acidobacteriia bacterium]|nr:dihydroorotate dehydrogenase-like protein [Terriglobia bacterium]